MTGWRRRSAVGAPPAESESPPLSGPSGGALLTGEQGQSGGPEKSKSDEATAVIWGGELNSQRKDVGGLTKVTQLAAATSYLAPAGCAAAVIIRKLAGRWIHQLTSRRCSARLLDEV